MGACHNLAGEFTSMGAKLIGLSCDTLENHTGWTTDILTREGKMDDGELAFPIISDADRTIVHALGMLDPDEIGAAGLPMPARALVILHGTTVKLSILYPATTGRNFEEVKRCLTSLQLTVGQAHIPTPTCPSPFSLRVSVPVSQGLATPVNWKYGERVIVGPPVKTEDAQAKWANFAQEELPSGKAYLRSVDCPAEGR